MGLSTFRAGFGLFATTLVAATAFAQAPPQKDPAPPAATQADEPRTIPPKTPAAQSNTEPQAPSADKPAPKASAKSAGTDATVVTLKTIEGIMGKSVRSKAGNDDMGRIVDVLVDGGGQIRAAVIDFGGFLGVGSRKVAVAWKTLDFTNAIQTGSVKATLTRDQIRQSPEYKPDEPVVILEGSAPPAAAAPSPDHNQDSPAR